MKKYKVTVNGVPYEIELEELTGPPSASAGCCHRPRSCFRLLPAVKR